MSTLRGLKQKLSTVSRLWDEQDYDQALAEVESLLDTWPGNPHLHVLKASLVQLQEEPKYELDEAKKALHQAIQLDKASPTASIELGHFLVLQRRVRGQQLQAAPSALQGVRPLGALIACLRFLQPPQQFRGREPHPRQQFAYRPIHLGTGQVGHLFPPTP